ncbi:MAG: hypothetical protein KatS3mg085_302 [Candidatus Dojkabacteria bacterium]|nr:MAG: hypothetical protein KatS3mg085_302 [Candidatus Dojkabacteria bacterium]
MLDIFLKPFYWWYAVIVRSYFIYLFLNYSFYLNKTDTIPMFKNIFVPLFGRKGITNRIISLFLRFWWVVFGFTFSTVLIIPMFLFGILLLILPFLPIIQTYRIVT